MTKRFVGSSTFFRWRHRRLTIKEFGWKPLPRGPMVKMVKPYIMTILMRCAVLPD
jgi:hypothetical protein